jgi:hypothetical protein
MLSMFVIHAGSGSIGAFGVSACDELFTLAR